MIICDAVVHPLLFPVVLIPTHSVNYSALEGAVGLYLGSVMKPMLIFLM